jgi:glycyl-tRNA synthetase beta chain
LDENIIPLEFAGLAAGRQSQGHRLLESKPLNIESAGVYERVVRNAHIVPTPQERKALIQRLLQQESSKIPGAKPRKVEVEKLLGDVANLTEYPSVILGNFDPEFLELPDEVLVTVMRDHQKYFAVEDANGKLLPHFLAVLNTDGDPKGIIRHGHERVLRARFNDARFFWQTDQKHPLRERGEWLKHVTFQKDLGSYYEKTLRVQRLCSWLSESIRQSGMAIRPGVVHKAAYLAKTDLTTELVKEFTELQGIVGGLYARVQQLDLDMPDSTRRLIADVIYDHYKPQSMEDSVPRTVEGAVLSIADKADTITGMFALGLLPTGSKDPFALRRQSNGIVRILGEKQIRFSLTDLLSSAASAFGTKEQQKIVRSTLHNILRPLGASGVFVSNDSAAEDEVTGPAIALAHNLGTFFKERLQFYLREHLGFRFDIVLAVTAASSDDVLDARQRAEAIAAIANRPEFSSIAIAFKRMHNIIRQAKEKSFQVAANMRPELFSDVERDLYQEMQPIGTAFTLAMQHHKYLDALNALVALAPRIAAFFENVMVMVDEPDVRSNRLLLLNQLGRGFSGIAHFSEIVTEGAKESPK